MTWDSFIRDGENRLLGTYREPLMGSLVRIAKVIHSQHIEGPCGEETPSGSGHLESSISAGGGCKVH